jgi:hypothetical protein
MVMVQMIPPSISIEMERHAVYMMVVNWFVNHHHHHLSPAHVTHRPPPLVQIEVFRIGLTTCEDEDDINRDLVSRTAETGEGGSRPTGVKRLDVSCASPFNISPSR